MKKILTVFIIFILLILFIFYIHKAINMHFKEEASYTIFSSHRHGRLGTSVFFKSLKKLDYQVEILEENSLPEDLKHENTVLFCLAPKLDIENGYKEDIIDFIKKGGRVLLTDSKTNRLMNFFNTAIEKNFYEWQWIFPGTGEMEKINLHDAETGESFNFLEKSIKTNKGIYLKCDWQKALTVYGSQKQSVIVLLSLGEGDIIIAADTYFISNEFLLTTPSVKLLKWILDKRKHVLVDEYHHGTTHYKGISFLLKKYHLHWFICYLFLLSLIYLWHIIPGFKKPHAIKHKIQLNPLTTLQGYAYLLKRVIPQNHLLETCLKEWLKSESNKIYKEKDKNKIISLTEQIRLINEEEGELIIRQYNEISDMINMI